MPSNDTVCALDDFEASGCNVCAYRRLTARRNQAHGRQLLLTLSSDQAFAGDRRRGMHTQSDESIATRPAADSVFECHREGSVWAYLDFPTL